MSLVDRLFYLTMSMLILAVLGLVLVGVLLYKFI